MRLVFGLVLILGLGLAGFAVYMAQGYIEQYEAALAKERAARAQQIPLTEIYVAARALRFGEPLAMADVKRIKFPADSLPEGAFTDEAALFPQGDALRRVVLRAIEANEPLLAVKLTEPGGDAGVATRLARGMRAFAINVDVASGVSGFLTPGDRVDVYWSGRIGDQEITKLIQTGIRLIAIDQIADDERLDPMIARTVTVEATPEQVAALAQAQATGRLSLALVGAEDDTVVGTVEIDQKRLLGIEEQVAVEAPQERVCTIRTRRGSETVEIPIPCTN
jgi:pilus assembly protein CpaB